MKKKILVMRFSAFGDVAMTRPVIEEFMQQNPDVEIVYLSRERFRDLFEGIPNFQFYSADLDGIHKGISGLFKLSKELKKLGIDEVADLHNVLRTKVLRTFLSMKKSAVLDKARDERAALVRKKNKVRKQLKPMVERYADVFRNLGYSLKLSHQLPKNTTIKENAIGVAPFAMYAGKMYPLEKTQEVVTKIAAAGFKVYLFGAKSENSILEEWESIHPNIKSVAGKLSLQEELALIQKLKLMVSMDSANMHLASMVGTRVISIWGNTHPFMGFLGYGQEMSDVIQDETLTIRPTSVFGKEGKNAEKIDYFRKIEADEVVAKILSDLS